MLFISAFLMGFLGSMHCVGMCGPLALALPPGKNVYLSKALYNTGRVLSYSLLGFTAGLIGLQFANMGFRNVFSIGIGILTVAVGILFFMRPTLSFARLESSLFLSKIKQVIARQFLQKNYQSNFIAGFFTGFLPCGFLFMALTASIAAPSPAASALFMALFASGTVPAMFLVSLLFGLLNQKTRNRLKYALPLFTISIGLYLIGRGLFITPEMHLH